MSDERESGFSHWFLGEPIKNGRAAQIPLRLLAHIGDAVFHLYEREREVKEASSVSQAHKRSRVDANQQAELLNLILPQLSESEREIVRRARNIKPSGYRKVKQSSYRQATAFEALLGYLYLENHERLKQVLAMTAPENLSGDNGLNDESDAVPEINELDRSSASDS